MSIFEWPLKTGFVVDLLFIVAPILGVCNCSMFCCALLCVHCSIAIILMGKRKLVALLNLSSWCLVIVERLFLAVPRCCLRFVIVVFPDHTHYFLLNIVISNLANSAKPDGSNCAKCVVSATLYTNQLNITSEYAQDIPQ